MTEQSYQDPICERYASPEMRGLFSPRRRALVWRDLWIALAEAQHALGLPVTAAQVEELRVHRDELNLEEVVRLEKRLRHDVVAHIHHYGQVAPGARAILHLGATSSFVTDNGDLILMREALKIVTARLLRMIHALSVFARREADHATLGLTHLQPAQLTTVGKRACLWIQDLVTVWEDLDELQRTLPFRGLKGSTGTQASFLQLFGGEASRVLELEDRVRMSMGFERVFPLTGQTYPRLWDYRISSRLAELAISLHKFSSDIRMLQSWGELEEPYEEHQVGSSAMPYKRNPMRSERMGALSKWLLCHAPGVGMMAATQWFERSLDDSALRRVALPQGFLTADSLLLIGRNVAEGLTVHPEVVSRRVAEQLPFIAVEELLMKGVSAGGDRQDLHERIRQLTWQAAKELRARGVNPLVKLLQADPELGPLLQELPPWEPA
ncbi:MAG: lyase family protein, partial [Planctomycetota bacterium]